MLAESPFLPSLPDDLLGELALRILRFNVRSAHDFCAASRHLQRFAAAVKRWAREVCAEWAPEHANGHLILDRTLVGLQFHCPYTVFAAGNLLPREGVTAWNLYVQLSSYNSGFVDLGVCDRECEVRVLISPLFFRSQRPCASQVAWGLNLHTGKLRLASKLQFSDCCAGRRGPRRELAENTETQVIPTWLAKDLFFRGSAFTLQVVVDHDRSMLFFGTHTPHKDVFTYWYGSSLPRHAQLRPHASLFYCTGDLVTISKHFFAVDAERLR